MAHSYQFVDSISATPTVLLDLDNNNPFGMDETSVSPPTLRRTTARGIRNDGDLEVASSYDSREIKIVLSMKVVAAETQATAIQTLARILDRAEGAWLKWQSEGMTVPMFYRTRRASFEVIDDVLDATPGRALRLTLDADPFGYGLPETGSFTITNDPTAGTNKMLYSFGTIKGDVPAPLQLAFPTPDGVHRTLVASRADYANSVLSAPFYQSLTAGTINSSPPAGWTVVDETDANMTSGNRRKLTKTSGTALVTPTAAVVQQWSSLPSGDYRVMVRVLGADAGTELLFFNRPPSTGSVLIREEAVGRTVVTATSAGRDWFDLGVVSMPGGAPLNDVVFGLAGATGPALWNVAAYASVAAVTLYLDCVVLIPAGRPGVITRQGTVTFPGTYINRAVTWDGLNYRRFAIGESSFTAGVSSVVAPSDLTGGNPLVAPSASNVLHFFTTTADPSSASRAADSKTATTAVTWTYYPRYLYTRPATT